MRSLTFPLTIGNDGSFTSVPHNHPAEIGQSLGLLLATRPGERRSNPEYGLPDPVFSSVTEELVEVAAAEWEPRAEPRLIETVRDGIEQTTTVYLDDEEA